MNNNQSQVHSCSECKYSYIKNILKIKYNEDEDKEIEEYIYMMQNKYKYNMCSVCILDDYFKRCSSCNVWTGDGSTCGMCKQLQEDD